MLVFSAADSAAPATISEEEMQAAIRGAEDDADAAAADAMAKEEANEAAEFNAEAAAAVDDAEEIGEGQPVATAAPVPK